MVNWGVTARTWNAKTPHEKVLEYETNRLQAQEDRNHKILKNERRMLHKVDAIAAESRHDAVKALRSTMYHNNMLPYGRYGAGPSSSPLMMMNRAAHLDLAYAGAGIGASPYLGGIGEPSYNPAAGYTHASRLGMGVDPAYGIGGYHASPGPAAYLDPAIPMGLQAGNIQARRELAFAQQQQLRQRQALAQRELLARQQYADMARVNRQYGLSPRTRTLSNPYMPYNGYAGADPRVVNIPYLGAGLGTPLVDPHYAADAVYEELAHLNVPPGSVRSRRLSTPFMSSHHDPVLF